MEKARSGDRYSTISRSSLGAQICGVSEKVFRCFPRGDLYSRTGMSSRGSEVIRGIALGRLDMKESQ